MTGVSLRDRIGFLPAFAIGTSWYFLFCVALAGAWDLGGIWMVLFVFVAGGVLLAYRKLLLS